MKSPKILPLLLAILFIYGCGLIDEIRGLQEIDFDIELYASRQVDISEDDPLEVAEYFTVDAKSNTDVADYINDIVEYDIWNIYIMVPYYEGENDILFDGTITIDGFSQSFTGTNAFNPSALYNSQGILYLNLNENALTTINTALINDHSVECSIVGTVSDKPVAFTLDFYIEGTVYAEIKK